MSINPIEQGSFQKGIQPFSKTPQQIHRKENELEKRADVIGEALVMAEEQLENMQRASSDLESKIEQINVETIRSRNESNRMKFVSLFLFGCSIITTLLIYNFKPVLEAGVKAGFKGH